ncbi:MAG: zinc ABC transporter substrate-binding protein [Acidiphilium sp.]|nr:zinc ABC transporter substrate-binding protein [Acidiphilium sp.]MDD4935461.1 zinc ABC transporter substrate-binding protein [Acidiphilium sp.]
MVWHNTLTLHRAKVLHGAAWLCVALAVVAVCGQAATAATEPTIIKVVGIENEYANVAQQIGGRYVSVSAIETNPNVDPHTFEASPKIVHQIAAAALVVVNGIGYDGWADKIIAAVPNPQRKVINVQHLLHLPDTTRNPHLWYDPKTMPAVARAVADDLAAMAPAHAAYFRANVLAFDASLQPWTTAIAAFKARYAGTPVAVTEPVGNYLLQAMGADIETPFSLQAAIMNGTDPSPQDVATQNALFRDHKIKIFVYNQQVTDPLTQSFLNLARKNGIPVVGVYETMPAPGYTYQSWMLAEVQALRNAVTTKTSTLSLLNGRH